MERKLYRTVSCIYALLMIYFVVCSVVLMRPSAGAAWNMFFYSSEAGMVNMLCTALYGFYGLNVFTGGSILRAVFYGMYTAFCLFTVIAAVFVIAGKDRWILPAAVMNSGDIICHILILRTGLPFASGLILKAAGLFILIKTYKIHKNDKKEKTDELT